MSSVSFLSKKKKRKEKKEQRGCCLGEDDAKSIIIHFFLVCGNRLARERAKTSFFAGQKDKTQNRREFNVTSLSCLRPARPIEKNSFISHTSLFVQFDVNIFK